MSTKLKVLAAAVLALTARGQSVSACRQQLWQDARAVSADLTAIRNELAADPYQQAVEQMADSLAPGVPTMEPALQTAFTRYLVTLRDVAADDISNGLVAAPLEQVKLANSTFGFIVAAGSSTDSPIDPILSSLISALGAIDGVSTDQLNADVTALITDAHGCRN